MRKKSIQVLGSGCQTCKQLLETTKKIAEELNIDTEIEYITDVSKIIEMGVMTSPVLAIDGKPVLIGKGRDEKEIRNALINNSSKKRDCDECCSCSCNC